MVRPFNRLRSTGRKKSSKVKRSPVHLFLPVVLLVMLSLLPILYITLRAHEAGWAEAMQLIFRPRVYELLENTLKLAVTVTLSSVVIGVITAWVVERTNIPGRKIWNVVVTLPFAVPAFVSSYSWISLFPWMEGFNGAVLVLTLSSYPLVHLPVAAALRGMNPSLEEVAQSHGYGRWKTFFFVTLPHLRPALLGGAILIALHMLAEFGALAFLNYDTFTTAIFDQYNVAFDGASAAMLTFVLLVLCLIFLGIEMLIRGNASYVSVQKGVSGKLKVVKLGLMAPIVLVGFSGLAILALGIPIGVIIYWIIVGSSASFNLAEIVDALTATLSYGVTGAVITILFALPLVMLSIRYKGIFSVLSDRLPYFIHSLPGLVVGLTLVYFAVHYVNPIYQTSILLLVGYAMLYLPLAQSSIRGVMVQVSERLEEVSRSLGKRSLTTFFKVMLPLISPGIGAGFALVCLEVMKELTATLLLRPTGVDTLATKIWQHTQSIEYAASAPYALLLILISGLPVYLLTMRSFTTKKKKKKKIKESWENT